MAEVADNFDRKDPHQSEIKNDISIIRSGAIRNFRNIYGWRGLKIVQDGVSVKFDTKGMESTDSKNFWRDYDFQILNPSLPIDHICSGLENYAPKNESQEELLKYAKRLSHYTESDEKLGLYIKGPSGTGKMHISVAIAKELWKNYGIKTYIVPEFYDFDKIIDEMDETRAWIIPRISLEYEDFSTFTELVEHACETDKVIIATGYDHLADSFKTYGEFYNKDLRNRLEDICKTMFVTKEINGPSHRKFSCDESVSIDNIIGTEKKIPELIKALDYCVEKEFYEKAAILRDKIKVLKPEYNISKRYHPENSK